jgi:branched-chain amino acid transport system permease protein
VGWFSDNGVTLVNGLATGMLLYMMAAGLTLIFGMMDVLNLAHGAFFLFGAYVAYEIGRNGDNWAIAALAALGVGAVLGVLLSVATRPLRSRGHLDQALLTFGAAFVLAGIASLLFGYGYKSVNSPPVLNGTVSITGQDYPVYRLVVIGVGLFVALVLFLVIERTAIGATVRAAVTDREMLSAMGVNVDVVMLLVFVVGGAVASIGGMIGAPILGVNPGLDDQVLLLALVVVTVGGLGSLKGALIGAIVIGEVQAIGTALFPSAAGLLLFGAMVAILVVRPQGLFGFVRSART